MATKNEEPSGTVNTKNILHEKVVCYSNSVGCKVGTKTMGQTIDGVVFRDVKKPINLHGKSASVNIVGVHFSNLTVQGNAVTTQTDADANWSINAYVSGITFGATP